LEGGLLAMAYYARFVYRADSSRRCEKYGHYCTEDRSIVICPEDESLILEKCPNFFCGAPFPDPRYSGCDDDTCENCEQRFPWGKPEMGFAPHLA
jgi:hypothetical protein